MTNRFDDVRRLADLEKIAKLDPSSNPNYWEMFKYKMATSPWLLEVVGCFQPGYAARLSKLYMLIDMYHPDNDEDLEMIEYLLKAAKIIEDENV